MMTINSRSLFSCILAIVFVTKYAAAVDVHAGPVGPGLHIYQLGLPGCSYEVALKVGSSAMTSPNGAAAFSEAGGTKADALMFSALCHAATAEDYCETIWRDSNLDTKQSILKLQKIKFYKNRNWRYSSLDFSSNATAVAEPRPRALYFCFSHQGKTVEGRVTIGDEVRDRAPEALKILRTLRIN